MDNCVELEQILSKLQQASDRAQVIADLVNFLADEVTVFSKSRLK